LSVNQAIWSEDPRQPVEGPYVIAKWVRDMTGLLRFVVVVGLSFSVLGVLLAFTGIYGLTSDLSQRATREIGIRKALGATRTQIVSLFVYQTARPTIPGVLAGILLGTAILRTLASEFEGIQSSRLWVVLAVAASFSVLVIVATWTAARRAADVDPALAMRVE
jgi:ABC-type antimicrobial peptide transport system permease subunit